MLVPEVVGPQFRLRPEPDLGVFKVQLHADENKEGLESTFEAIAPPTGRQTGLKGGLDCACIAPGEWLLIGPEVHVADLAVRLNSALEGSLALVTDLSDGRTGFILSGSAARDRLAAVCPLDLRDAVFPVGSATRSLVGEAALFVARLPDAGGAPMFRLIVDQSTADYASRMIGLP